MKSKILTISLITLLAISACQKTGDDHSFDQSFNDNIPTIEPIYRNIDLPTWSFSDSRSDQNITTVNKGENREVVLYMAEYFTLGDNDEVGNVIYFNNRGNKQLGADFVANSQYNIYTDKTNDISYYVDEGRSSDDLGVGISTQAIDRSMETWDDITCSDLGIIKRPYDSRIKTGVVAGVAHPIYDWSADVVHAGWMPLDFFNWFSGGRGSNILGVTFTFIIEIDGVASDDDKNGKPDVWFREIYYNDAFTWSDGGNLDIETVALHEAGHGLSQGHFGKAFRNKGGLHFAPRAVMNASYSGIQTSIAKTDNGGHCSNWGSWPNK